MTISFCKVKQLTENHSIELQIEMFNDVCSEWIDVTIASRTRQDHAGFVIRFELLRVLYFCITFYDHRHYEEIYNDTD